MGREMPVTHGQNVSLSLIGKRGEQARRWRGDEAGYVVKHSWLTKHYSKGNACEECGSTDFSRLEWANISGRYLRDRSDYKVLCPPCHRKQDLKKQVCPVGHEYTNDNVRLSKEGWRSCKTCHRIREAKRRLAVRNA